MLQRDLQGIVVGIRIPSVCRKGGIGAVRVPAKKPGC
jgi:hypothetical protein